MNNGNRYMYFWFYLSNNASYVHLLQISKFNIFINNKKRNETYTYNEMLGTYSTFSVDSENLLTYIKAA